MNSIEDKYKAVWKLMKKYSFNINPYDNRDLLCAICNKILVNAHQNECGCRFCYKCIKTFMATNNKPCPGNSDECIKKIIDKNNIQEDYAANKRLSGIPVKCPIGSCTYTDCLINISTHMKSHMLDCPFVLFGCCQAKYNASDIQCHLTEENSAHYNLIFQYINNVKIDLKNSQKNEINKIGKQFIELYENQETKINKLELENEEFKKLNEKVVRLELENEELMKLNKMVSQLQLEYEEFRSFQEIVAHYQFENTEFRKIDGKIEQLQLKYEKFTEIAEKVEQIQLESETFRKINEKVEQIQLVSETFSRIDEKVEQIQLVSETFSRIDEKVEQIQLVSETFSKIDEKVEQIQLVSEKLSKIDEKVEQIKLECEKLKLTNNIANSISTNEQNEIQKTFEKLTQAMDEMKNNIDQLRKFEKQDNSSTKSVSRESEKTRQKSPVNGRKSVGRSYSQSIPSNSRKIHENYKVKYEIICQQMSDLKKEMKSSQRAQKDMKYTLGDLQKMLGNSNYSDEISQLKKNLERYKMKMCEEESNSKVISDEFQKLKRDLKKYLFQPDECIEKFKLINIELTEIKQNRDKIKFQLDKITIENQVIKDKLSAGNEKLKEDMAKVNDKIDNDIQSMLKHLENNLIDHKKEIEEMKCAELEKINDSLKKTASQCQADIEIVTSNLNDVHRDLLLLSSDYDSTKSTNSASMEKFQESQLEIQLFIDNNVKKHIKSFESFTTINDFVQRLKNELSKLRVDFSLSYKNLISDMDNVKSDLKTQKSMDSKLQLQIANSNAEIALISKNFISNQLSSNKLMKNLEEINLFRSNLETLQTEMNKNREEIRSLKISGGKLSEEIKEIISDHDKFNKIIGNQDIINKIIGNPDIINKIIENQDIINKIIGNQDKINKIIVNQDKINNIIGNQDIIKKIMGNQDIINTMGEFQQVCNRKFNDLLSSQNDANKKQDEVAKEFHSLSKRFLNLRTECVNIKADIASQLAPKKPLQYREWSLGNFSKKLQKSKLDEEFCVMSDWFQLTGYRMSFKIYPNGDALCANKFMSVFFFIQKLPEFVEEKKKYRLTISLVDRLDQSKSFTKEYDYYNYIKPEINLRNSHELGASDFILLDELRGNSRFISNDSLLFRFIVKPS